MYDTIIKQGHVVLNNGNLNNEATLIYKERQDSTNKGKIIDTRGWVYFTLCMML